MIDFVNSVDPETGIDSIATGKLLRAWLIDRRLLARASQTLDASEHGRAIRLRDALRALMLANSGGAHDEHAAGGLDDVARRGELAVRFAADGSVSLAPRGHGFDRALAGLLVPTAHASIDGTWARVKVCREPGCREAFYDHSRNRAGVWCDMAICGNRAKVRNYRARGRGETGRKVVHASP